MVITSTTVKNIEQTLREGDAAAPTETGSSKELITLARDPASADIFSNMDLLTYRVGSARRKPASHRFISLARALTLDMIAPEARKKALKSVLRNSMTR